LLPNSLSRAKIYKRKHFFCRYNVQFGSEKPSSYRTQQHFSKWPFQIYIEVKQGISIGLWRDFAG
jgi:hypothetical protein